MHADLRHVTASRSPRAAKHKSALFATVKMRIKVSLNACARANQSTQSHVCMCVHLSINDTYTVLICGSDWRISGICSFCIYLKKVLACRILIKRKFVHVQNTCVLSRM